MLVARGRYALMVDADGATKFADLERLEKRLLQVRSYSALMLTPDLRWIHLTTTHVPMLFACQAERNGLGVAVGSRHHLQEKSEAVAQVPCRPLILCTLE